MVLQKYLRLTDTNACPTSQICLISFPFIIIFLGKKKKNLTENQQSICVVMWHVKQFTSDAVTSAPIFKCTEFSQSNVMKWRDPLIPWPKAHIDPEQMLLVMGAQQEVIQFNLARGLIEPPLKKEVIRFHNASPSVPLCLFKPSGPLMPLVWNEKSTPWCIIGCNHLLEWGRKTPGVRRRRG